MTRRKPKPSLTLTRVPSYEVSRIAGYDADGQPWAGIDATRGDVVCHACGRQVQYGYVGIGGNMRDAHCVGCVAIEDVQNRTREAVQG